MAAKKYYAVKKGRTTGILGTWTECKTAVHGYPGALYKSFTVREEAERYLDSAGWEETPETSESSTVPTEKDTYTIYVDGSYINGAYGWGFAAYLDGELIHTAKGQGTNPAAVQIRNVAGELAATMQAVRWAEAQGIAAVTICHDYIGISEWAQRRWKTNNEITAEYARFMQPYTSWVRFKKVDGHTGVEGNELADRLAKAGAAGK